MFSIEPIDNQTTEANKTSALHDHKESVLVDRYSRQRMEWIYTWIPFILGKINSFKIEEPPILRIFTFFFRLEVLSSLLVKIFFKAKQIFKFMN